jgi:hypothetical protein
MHTKVLVFYVRIRVFPTSAVVTGITETTVAVMFLTEYLKTIKSK